MEFDTCHIKIEPEDNPDEPIVEGEEDPLRVTFKSEVVNFDQDSKVIIEPPPKKKRNRIFHVVVCPWCQKEFRDKFNFQRHAASKHDATITNESNEKSFHFQCEVCTKKFAEKDNLTYHWFTHTGDKIWSCQLCPIGYGTKVPLEKHYIDIHRLPDPTPWMVKKEFDSSAMKCKVCPQVIDGFPALVNHYNSEHPEIEETRLVEVPVNSQKLDLDTFMTINKEAKIFACNLCLKTFADKKNLEPHLYSHTGERLYGCEVCPRSLDSLMKLKHHYDQCHPQERFPKDKDFMEYFYAKHFCCAKCSVQIKGLIPILKHLQNIHLEELRQTLNGTDHYSKVPSEGEEIHGLSDPDPHSERQNVNCTSKKPIANTKQTCVNAASNQCLFCDQAFQKLSLLKNHLRICKSAKSISNVTKELPNQCLFCKQAFEKLSILKAHLTTCEFAKRNY